MDPDSRRWRGNAAPAGRGGLRGRLRRGAASASLRVTVTDGRGRRVQDPGLARWLAGVTPPRVRGEVGIALVSDARARAMNQHYRKKDAPTDVLSFSAPDDEAGYLGDLAIATGVARRQARAAGHSYRTELRVLALHGLLHLLGYDHEHPDDAGRMRRVEARLRRKGGLQEGLIARTHRGRRR